MFPILLVLGTLCCAALFTLLYYVMTCFVIAKKPVVVNGLYYKKLFERVGCKEAVRGQSDEIVIDNVEFNKDGFKELEFWREFDRMMMKEKENQDV